MRRPFVFMVSALLVVAGLGHSARALERAAEQSDAHATPDSRAKAPTLEIRMAGETFSPGVLTIDVGQTVIFINDDTDDHTAAGSGFNTGTLRPGETARVTFDEVRSFRYICRFHPHMQARIVVRKSNEDPPGSTPPASPVAGTPIAIGPTRVSGTS